jgi:hypothetical protein
MSGDCGAMVVTSVKMIAATSRRKNTPNLMMITRRKTPGMTQVILLEKGHCCTPKKIPQRLDDLDVMHGPGLG